MKYETRQLTWSGYRLFKPSDDWLIWLGTIRLKKMKWKNRSQIVKNSGSFNYKGINFYFGNNVSVKSDRKWYFKPKRIIVIQMI